MLGKDHTMERLPGSNSLKCLIGEEEAKVKGVVLGKEGDPSTCARLNCIPLNTDILSETWNMIVFAHVVS